MTCRYDKAAERHLLRTHLPACTERDCQGCEPCLRDANGNPVKHCTARVGCNGHLADHELTCPGCIEKVRTTLRVIADLAADALLEEATYAGVDSEAAYLNGPAADPEAWSWRKVAARQGVVWHASLEEDDDEHHPYSVLTRWEFMLREDYGQPRPPIGCRATGLYELEAKPVHQANQDDCHRKHGPNCWSDAESPTWIASAAGYLDRNLYRIANDEHQDWRLFASELNACRSHLESVLHDSRAPEMGAPCPACTTTDTKGKPLVKHYRNMDDNGRINLNGALDWWGCQDQADHWWADEDYRHRVATAYLVNSTRLTAPQIADTYGIPAGSIRSWASTGRINKRGKDDEGRQMYDVNDARRCAGHTLTDVIA